MHYEFGIQALLFNILPAHVAQHFLRKDIHQRDEQLYSQSYTSVGVLFASIPNFSGKDYFCCCCWEKLNSWHFAIDPRKRMKSFFGVRAWRNAIPHE
jgi:hypothetical protein